MSGEPAVLDMAPVGQWADRRPRYGFHNPFRSMKVCRHGFETSADAFGDAVNQSAEYERRYLPGGMATALGVAVDWPESDAKWVYKVEPDGLYHGVYGFYYSPS